MSGGGREVTDVVTGSGRGSVAGQDRGTGTALDIEGLPFLLQRDFLTVDEEEEDEEECVDIVDLDLILDLPFGLVAVEPEAARSADAPDTTRIVGTTVLTAAGALVVARR